MLKSAIFLDFYKINRGVSGLWPFVLTLTKHILLSSLFHYINLVSYLATVVGESGSETKKEKKQILIVPSTFALKLFRVKIAMFVLTKISNFWLILASHLNALIRTPRVWVFLLKIGMNCVIILLESDYIVNSYVQSYILWLGTFMSPPYYCEIGQVM